jgi:glycosyltransferase involved in cell wall biosynthesis
MLKLAAGLRDLGVGVHLVMARRKGHFLDRIPDGVELVDLRAPLAITGWSWLAMRSPAQAGRLLPALCSGDVPRVLGAIPPLVRYLDDRRPDAIISALNYTNICSLIASELSRHQPTRVVTLHNNLSALLSPEGRRRNRLLGPLIRHYLPRADHRVAVSRGVADGARSLLGASSIQTIHNPIVEPALARAAAEPPEHPWLRRKTTPVVLAIGKLKPQKDFPTLLRAFAALRRRREARLVILGEGPDRASLWSLAGELGIAGDLDLPGFIANPMALLSNADVFALSSRYEGFGNVVAEALACGCPVVSTDCPWGPSEILENGRYGRLVPPEDPQALAEGLEATLDESPDPAALRDRAQAFSVADAARSYLALLQGGHGD